MSTTSLDGARPSARPTSPTISVSTTGADTSGPSSRRTSISSLGRPGTAMSARSGSGTSSRSTSFSLPNDARSAIRADGRLSSEEVEVDEEMDEECEFSGTSIFYFWFFCFVEPTYLRDYYLAAAKHAEFVRARGRHYSNEAEAMKVSCGSASIRSYH